MAATSIPDESTYDGTVDGNPLTLPVYGRVPAMTAVPAFGTYTDTVTITVTY